MKTVVVIPTYNERENVVRMAEAVLANADSALGRELELLFVDDNSPDGTGSLVDGMAAGNPLVHCLHRALSL